MFSFSSSCISLTIYIISYRIHLSPGSRRSSGSATRAAMTRAMGVTESVRSKRDPQRKRGQSTPSPPPSISSPPLAPPALAPAHLSPSSLPIPDTPDTPPPLTQAHLPGLMSVPPPPPESTSSHPSTASTPEVAYYSPNSHAPLQLNGHSQQNSPESMYPSSQSSQASPELGLSNDHNLWEYRNRLGHPYQHTDQVQPSQGNGSNYVHHSQPPSPAQSIGGHHHGQAQDLVGEPYPHSGRYDLHYRSSLPGLRHFEAMSSTSPPVQYTIHSDTISTGHDLQYRDPASSAKSRHSIAHISHPQSLPSPSPLSSISSLGSHPPTPVYHQPSAIPVSKFSGFHNAPASTRTSPSAQYRSSHFAVQNVPDQEPYTSAGYSEPQSRSSPSHSQSRVLPEFSDSDYATSSLQHRHSYVNPRNLQTYHTGQAPSNQDQFTSPPPVLAPIHGERDLRAELGSHHSDQFHAHVNNHPHPQQSHYLHAHVYLNTHTHLSSQTADAGLSDVPHSQVTNHCLHLHHPQPQHPLRGHQEYLHLHSSVSSGSHTDPR